MPSKFTSKIPWREKFERQQEAKIVDINIEGGLNPKFPVELKHKNAN
jgi:hypothetical protein